MVILKVVNLALSLYIYMLVRVKNEIYYVCWNLLSNMHYKTRFHKVLVCFSVDCGK